MNNGSIPDQASAFILFGKPRPTYPLFKDSGSSPVRQSLTPCPVTFWWFNTHELKIPTKMRFSGKRT